MSNTYDFMNDERIKSIAPEKLELLTNLYEKAKTAKSNEMIPLFLATNKTAKEKGLSFSNEESDVLISIIKQGLDEKEAQKVDAVLKLTKLLQN